MTQKGHDGLDECKGPGCSNSVQQKPGSGRPRLYCCDNCGAKYRKHRGSRHKAVDNDAYAALVADDYAQHALQLAQLIHEGRPEAALHLLVQCEQDWKDVRAATVQLARDRKMKGADIAAALHISQDTVSRAISADHIATRRKHRAPRPAATTSTTPLPATPAGKGAPHQHHPLPAPAPPSRPAGGFPDRDNGPPALGPAASLARALSHLHRLSNKTLRALSEAAAVDPSYVSRVLSGERLPSWKVTRNLVLACDGDPDELHPLWNAARGYRIIQPTSLHAALRGLHLAAALPEPDLIRARAHDSLSVEDITGMLNGSRLPDWNRVDHLVGALHGQPEAIRPLWEAAKSAAQEAVSDAPAVPGVPSVSDAPAVSGASRTPPSLPAAAFG
ncbi:helix-turn-helix domain-containing protein [Streptomyces sp. NPDC088116]|uniref:helix-turn-helix domain-containing protein n=1 Tax=Streptomyces sp. NPDC088116 TaxID=3365825 RepID=UPI0037F6FA13